jgi:hypothetical protein
LQTRHTDAASAAAPSPAISKIGALEATPATSGGNGAGAFQEDGMAEAKSSAVPVGAGLAKEAELWIGAQRDLLAGIETMIAGWAQRQRQAYQTSSRSMQRICEARNLFDLVQAQHEWLSDCLDWTLSEIRAAGSEIPAITRKAAGRFGEAENGLHRGNPAAQIVPNISEQRAAAE